MVEKSDNDKPFNFGTDITIEDLDQPTADSNNIVEQPKEVVDQIEEQKETNQSDINSMLSPLDFKKKPEVKQSYGAGLIDSFKSMFTRKGSGSGNHLEPKKKDEPQPSLFRNRSKSFDCSRPGDEAPAEVEVEEDKSQGDQFEHVENQLEQYLILLVHGIGNNDEHQQKNLSEFKKSIHKVCSLKFSQGSHFDYVIRMVDWKSIVNTEQTNQKVKNVTITDGAQTMREMFNQTVVDILFYLSKQYRYQILQKVAEECRKYYNELRKNGENSRFKGKVSIVGHSLGTVITYDLLCRQWSMERASTKHMFSTFNHQKQEEEKLSDDSELEEIFEMGDKKLSIGLKQDSSLQLPFQLEHYFLMGSPLGLFISIYNDENFIRQKLPTCKYFYNIFHPQDLIAYRIEPLFKNFQEQSFQQEILPPVRLPYYKNNGYRIISNLLFNKTPNLVFHSAFEQLNEIKKSYDTEDKKNLLQTSMMTEGYGGIDQNMSMVNSILAEQDDGYHQERFDYVIQEKGLEAIVKPVGLIKSHMTYFESKDIAFFILKKIHKQHDMPIHL